MVALVELRHNEFQDLKNRSSKFTCERVYSDPRPSVQTYVGCREACSTVITIPGTVCYGFTYLWKSKQCELQLAVVFDESQQGTVTLERTDPKKRSRYCYNDRADFKDKESYGCVGGGESCVRM